MKKAKLDISLDICPITFVKFKIAIQNLKTGQALEVNFGKNFESFTNITSFLKGASEYKIVKINKTKNGSATAVVLRVS